MSLTKPEAPKGVVTLAGGANALAVPEPEPESDDDPPPDQRVLVIGESVAPQPGRADDFTWPRGKTATAPESVPAPRP